MGEVIASHTNSEGEQVTLERVVGGRFDGAMLLVLHDDPPMRVAAPMLLDDGTRAWLLRELGTGVRAFVREAHDKAEATTDDEVRATANAPAGDPGSIARFSYAQGLRDGVVMACEQVLAKLDAP